MANRRINAIATTTTTAAADDYLALDGSANGTRKILWNQLNPLNAVGGIYLTATAETSITDTTNFFKAAGTTALNNSESTVVNIDMPANNRLRYTGARDIKAIIVGQVSISCASNNQDTAVRLYKYDDSAGSGATLVHSQILRKIGTGADIGAFSINGDCILEQNDYLELHVRNLTGTANITIESMYLRFTGTKA